MKIADLDIETKRVIVMAHAIDRFPTEENRTRLHNALEQFDKKHESERAKNLITAIWCERGHMRGQRGCAMCEELV